VGQNARYTFSGTSGQNFSVVWTGNTFSGSSNYIYVYKPNGTLLTSTYFASAAGGTFDLGALPTTGTYTLFFSPYKTATGQVTLAVTQDDSATLTIDGSTVARSLVAGQNGRYTFSGTAGQNLGLGLSSLSTTPSGGSVLVYVYKPDGSSLSFCNSYSGSGGECDLPVLPTTGTYTILVDPSSTNAASFTLTLSSDTTGSLTPNGSGLAFSTARVGQNARYTFSGTSGQSYTVVWSGNTFAGPYNYVYIYKPNGTQLTNTYFSSANGSLSLGALPTTGTYTIFFTPYATSTGQVTLSVTNP
jgi:hypothetical protein